MRRLCGVAAERRVAIGAHVGYRDPDGLGRRPLDVDPKTIEAETREQIETLQRIAAAEGTKVRYVKPHGALYTRATTDRSCAEAIVHAARKVGGIKAMLGLPGSELLERARRSTLEPVAEGFADRSYLADGSLVPRSNPKALRGEDDAVRQALQIAVDRSVVTVDGKRITVRANSICIHGDSPAAQAVARRLGLELRDAGIELKPFA
jgi:UPF0271 protein